MQKTHLKCLIFTAVGLSALSVLNSALTFTIRIYLFTLIASFASLGFLFCNRHRYYSFANFFVLGSFIFFPAAVLLLLTLPDPTLSIEIEYWESAPQVLHLYTFSIILFWTGYLIFSGNFQKLTFSQYSSIGLPTFKVNLLLVCSVTLYVLAGIQSGTYFHISVSGEYNSDFVESFGFFQYFVFLGNVGISLQLIRVLHYNTLADKVGLFILALLMLIFLFPSGSRRPVIFIFAVLIYFYLISLSSNRARIRVLLVSMISVFIMLPLMETFRLAAANSNGLLDNILSLVNIITSLNFGENDQYSGILLATIIAARRIADFCSVAHIMEYFNHSEYRNISSIADGILYALPNGLRPPIALSMTYDAEFMKLADFRPSSPGSAPMMFLGDAYSFGGYPSVSIIFFLVGILFSFADKIISRKSLLSLFVFIFLLDQALSLSSYSVVKVYIFFFRQLGIAIVLYFLLRLFTQRRCKSFPSNKTNYLATP